MLHCHQCSDDTQLSISFPLDPDTAAGNLKQCLAEIGSWRKASWLLLNLDKAEIMLISRGKCFEDLVKFHHREEPGSILLAPSLQILIDIDRVYSQLALLEAEQDQFP
ncbi:hypothetical protein HGM15179_001740 [Zosterops borbonicus]|uniref:Uncharacterized protein n=1 Tax=Zosterops borbonicus TaxID=364589 RepID=A0A8K1GV87_9PASS|nr:hypothetical protein HGM15179_001740 [Zosterops borbonicus]